jgi:hypothetical protein
VAGARRLGFFRKENHVVRPINLRDIAQVGERYDRSVSADFGFKKVHADDYKGWPVTLSGVASVMDSTPSGASMAVKTINTRTEIEVPLAYTRDFSFKFVRRPWFGALVVATLIKMRRSSLTRYPPVVQSLIPNYFVGASGWESASQLLSSITIWQDLSVHTSGTVTVKTHEGDDQGEKTLRYTSPGLITTDKGLTDTFDLVVRLVETMGDWLPEESAG